MAYTTAAVMSSSKGPRPRLVDFLLSWAPRRRQTGEEQLAVFQGLVAQMQPKDVTRGDHR